MRQMSRSTTAKAVAAAAVAAAAGLAASPASAASHSPAPSAAAKPQGFVPRARAAPAGPDATRGTIMPATIGGCHSSGGVTECAHITGHGNWVSNFSMYHVCVVGTGMWIRDYISADGNAITWTRPYYRSGYNCMPNLKIIESSSFPGTWHFNVQRENSNGTYTTIDHVNLKVD
jgi:anaerobic selenocysteine-containing dehydrogenase